MHARADFAKSDSVGRGAGRDVGLCDGCSKNHRLCSFFKLQIMLNLGAKLC